MAGATALLLLLAAPVAFAYDFGPAAAYLPWDTSTEWYVRNFGQYFSGGDPCFMENMVPGPNPAARATGMLMESIYNLSVPGLKEAIEKCAPGGLAMIDGKGPPPAAMVPAVPYKQCRSLCDDITSLTGAEKTTMYSFGKCPLNIAGCCDCSGFMTFKFGPNWGAGKGSYKTGWDTMGYISSIMAAVMVAAAMAVCATRRKGGYTPAWLRASTAPTSKMADEGAGDAVEMTPLQKAGTAGTSAVVVGSGVSAAAAQAAVRAPLLSVRVGSWPTWVRNFATASAVATGFAMGLWIYGWFMGDHGFSGQNYAVWPYTSGLGILLHAGSGAAWAISGGLQFTGALRKRWPSVHRATGYIYILAELVCVVGLVIVAFSPHRSGNLVFWCGFLFALLWLITLYQAFAMIRKGRVHEHRMWMTRNYFIGFSVIFQRAFNLDAIHEFVASISHKQSDFMSICLGTPGSLPISIHLSAEEYQNEANCTRAGQLYSWTSSGTCQRALSPAEINYNCVAVNYLLSMANGDFWIVFTYCGLLACETWLWVRHGDGWLASFASSLRGKAYTFVREGGVHVRGHFEGALKLIRCAEETADAQRLTFALPHPRMLVPVPPGHHFLLRQHGKGTYTSVVRPYTPVASEPGEISFVVKRVAGGAMSSFLLDNLKVGSAVYFDGPHGEFRYAPGTYARYGFVCGGSGVTPVLSVLRTALADPIDTTLFDVLVSNRTRAQMLCCDELAALAAAHPDRLSLHHALSREAADDAEAAGRKVHSGRVTAALVKATMPRPGEHSAVACCGNVAFNFAVMAHFRAAGYTWERIFAFGTTDR